IRPWVAEHAQRRAVAVGPVEQDNALQRVSNPRRQLVDPYELDVVTRPPVVRILRDRRCVGPKDALTEPVEDARGVRTAANPCMRITKLNRGCIPASVYARERPAAGWLRDPLREVERDRVVPGDQRDMVQYSVTVGHESGCPSASVRTSFEVCSTNRTLHGALAAILIWQYL